MCSIEDKNNMDKIEYSTNTIFIPDESVTQSHNYSLAFKFFIVDHVHKRYMFYIWQTTTAGDISLAVSEPGCDWFHCAMCLGSINLSSLYKK